MPARIWYTELHLTGVSLSCVVAVPADGTQGRLRIAMNLAAVQAIAASPPSYAISLVVPPDLLRTSTLTLLTTTSGLKTAGVLVLPPDPSSPNSVIPNPPAEGYSSACPTPQLLNYIPSQPAIPDRPTQVTQFNNSYRWNPLGDASELLAFQMGIVTLTEDEASYVVDLAQENEANEASGSFVSQTAQFFYYMYAQDSTVQCLQDGQITLTGRKCLRRIQPVSLYSDLRIAAIVVCRCISDLHASGRSEHLGLAGQPDAQQHRFACASEQDSSNRDDHG
jgi:hypothetical protein